MSQRGACAWLAGHGFAQQELDTLPVGLLGNCREMRQALQHVGYTSDEVGASQVAADPRLSDRMIGPIRDDRGRIVSFWVRRPDEQRPGMLFRGTWYHSVPVFGLDTALRGSVDVSRPLVLVEDLFDALLLHAKGFRTAIATAGSLAGMSPGLEHLAALGVRHIILCPGEHSRNDRSVERSLDNASRALRSPQITLLPPEPLGSHPTVGALVRDRGLAAFEDLLRCLPLTDAEQRKPLLEREKPPLEKELCNQHNNPAIEEDSRPISVPVSLPQDPRGFEPRGERIVPKCSPGMPQFLRRMPRKEDGSQAPRDAVGSTGSRLPVLADANSAKGGWRRLLPDPSVQSSNLLLLRLMPHNGWHALVPRLLLATQ